MSARVKARTSRPRRHLVAAPPSNLIKDGRIYLVFDRVDALPELAGQLANGIRYADGRLAFTNMIGFVHDARAAAGVRTAVLYDWLKADGAVSITWLFAADPIPYVATA